MFLSQSRLNGVVIAQVAFVLSVFALVAFGILGLGRVAMPSDTYFLYNAGKIWASGGNPYDFNVFKFEYVGVTNIHDPFAYPPQAFLLSIFFYLGGYSNVVALANGLSLLSIAAIVIYTIFLLKEETSLLKDRPAMPWWIAA